MDIILRFLVILNCYIYTGFCFFKDKYNEINESCQRLKKLAKCFAILIISKNSLKTGGHQVRFHGNEGFIAGNNMKRIMQLYKKTTYYRTTNEYM